MRVQDAMSTRLDTLTKSQTARAAAQLIVDSDHGTILIVDQNDSEKLIGILSDYDVLKGVVLENKDAGTVPIEDIMTTDVLTIDPEKTMSEFARIIRGKKFRRLPVVKDGKLLGIVSSSDVLQCVVEAKKEMLDMALEF